MNIKFVKDKIQQLAAKHIVHFEQYGHNEDTITMKATGAIERK